MKNNNMTNDAQQFIKALKIMNHGEGKEMAQDLDADTGLIYEIWYKEISSACAKIYTKDKVRRIKKQLLETARKQIETLESRKKSAYDSLLGIVTFEEERRIKKIEDGMKAIEELDEKEIIGKIISSLYVSETYLETLKHRKETMEKSKLSKLSFNGEKTVEDDKVNSKIAKKIYDEIINKGLTSISQRVEETLNTNEQFVNLRKTEKNAKNIIIYEVSKIYRDKIAKIRMEIQQDLEALSNKYKSFTSTDDLNLVRIKAQLEKDLANAGILTSKKKKEKYNELITAITGTIQHEQDFKEYVSRIEGFEMTQELKNVFGETNVKDRIREHRTAIMNRTGIIIDKISEEIIDHETEQLKKEVKAKANRINETVKIMCTQEEKARIEDFANTVGLSVKETVNFLRNEDSVYACLFAHLFGNEVLNKIDNDNANVILEQIDPEWKFKKNRVEPTASRLCTQKEDTKPQITAKQYQLKIPPKK